MDARDRGLAGGEFKAPKPLNDDESPDSGRNVRRSTRPRKAPVKREYVEPDSEDVHNVPSSPPKPRLPSKSAQSRPSNRSVSRPSRIRNSNGQFVIGMDDGYEYGDEDDYDEEYYYDYALGGNDIMRDASQVAPTSYRYELDEDRRARSPAFGQTQVLVRAEVEQHALPGDDDDDRNAALQLAVEASLHSPGIRRGDEGPGAAANPGDGGTTIPRREGAPGGANVALPSRPKKPRSGLWTGKNWVDLGEEEHHTLSQDFPELDRHGVPVGSASVLGKRVRKPARSTETQAPPSSATGVAKRSKVKQGSSRTKKPRTSAPTESPGGSSSLSSLSSSSQSPLPARSGNSP